MKMVESIPQVWEVVVGLLLKVNKLYYRQLILLDPAYYILRVFVSEHNFSNSVVKKVLFGLSSYMLDMVHILLSKIQQGISEVQIC